MKKVLLVVIDALAARVVLPAMKAGHLPCLQRLAERGVLRERCTSIFPSITPAATAAIATGVYPVDHFIAGGFWYDRREEKVAYYGDDFWVVANKGINQFFHEFLVELNLHRLHADTIYQWVERGGLTAAVINYMWFRGDHTHQVNPPPILRVLPGINRVDTVEGPRILALADFAASRLPGSDHKLRATGGVKRRFGFHDETTGEYLLCLADAEPFPDLTVAYFPNNDFVSHEESPQVAESTLRCVDSQLSQFIDKRGGLDRFLQEFSLLVLGDHAQSNMVPNVDQIAIDMCRLLADFKLATPGKHPQISDELVICPNMRACHVYLKPRTCELRDRVVEQLLSEQKIDQVIYRDGVWGATALASSVVVAQKDTFQVLTRDRGRLRFSLAANDSLSALSDEYGNHWDLDGDLSCIDAAVIGGKIVYHEYPNALERIMTSFSHLSDDIWVTARVGFEFKVVETSVHGGGSHGALNRDDSESVLLTSGVPAKIQIPKNPRTIDVAPLILRILGLDREADRLIAERTAGPGG
ncbi:alkaline phosphatase family protein [Planctomycetaceae bacterium SH139]